MLMAARHDVLPHEPVNQMRIMWELSETLHGIRGRIAARRLDERVGCRRPAPRGEGEQARLGQLVDERYPAVVAGSASNQAIEVMSAIAYSSPLAEKEAIMSDRRDRHWTWPPTRLTA